MKRTIIAIIISIVVTAIITTIATTNYIIRTLEINGVESNGEEIENGEVYITINNQCNSYYYEK